MWFLFAILTTLLWAGADVFYKKGADADDRFSHIKTAIMVGVVMGVHGVIYMIAKGISFDPVWMIKYFPVSAMYILSMILGYFGLRYLELSISSPIQNSSGALCTVLLFIFFTPSAEEILSVPGILNIVGIIIITAGVVWLAVIEKREDAAITRMAEKKYISGFVAIIFPILYCIFDALGTTLDGIYLDELSIISEDNALLAYEFTFFVVAVICALYLKYVKKEKIIIRHEKNRISAAVFETLGQFFYVFAMSKNAMIAAPLIASYCIFSVIFSRMFLSERLSGIKYATVCTVIAGIVLLGISEGIS